MSNDNVVPMNGRQSTAADAGPKIPMSAADVARMKPEEIPTFTTVAAVVDRTMSRLPWWVVAGGSAAATWWLLRKR